MRFVFFLIILTRNHIIILSKHFMFKNFFKFFKQRLTDLTTRKSLYFRDKLSLLFQKRKNYFNFLFFWDVLHDYSCYFLSKIAWIMFVRVLATANYNNSVHKTHKTKPTQYIHIFGQNCSWINGFFFAPFLNEKSLACKMRFLW